MDKLMGSGTSITIPSATTITLRFDRPSSQYVEFAFTNVMISRLSDSHSLNEFMVEEADLLTANLTVTEVQS
jgi:hypothetical protein